MASADVPIPYCGLPPAPDTLWSRWNLDPILIACLIVCAAAYAFGNVKAARTGQRIPRWRQTTFYIGWIIAAAALISPLCPLSVSLFAARVGQHMILTLIAAPLVAAGRPFALAGCLWHRPIARRTAIAPLCASAMFAALIWFWHAPAPYAETFRSTFVYWSMHITVFGSALWLWTSLIDAPPVGAARVIVAGLISTVQMSFLGALITLALRPLYTPHLLTTVAWGLTPLQDQQLGGVIMWVPGCVVFFVISTLILWNDIVRAELAATPAKAVSR